MMKSTAHIKTSNGHTYKGYVYNISDQVFGSLCFTTAMTGYQEVITDPSYSGQVVVFSFPHIGNVGTTSLDIEAESISLRAVVMAYEPTIPSNWRNEQGFLDWLIQHKVPVFITKETRSIIKEIRAYPNTIGHIVINTPSLSGNRTTKLSSHESKLEGHTFQDETFFYSQDDLPLFAPQLKSEKTIVLINFGVKRSIIIETLKLGYSLVILNPYGISEMDSVSRIRNLMNIIGIVISNGPGDPKSHYENNKDLIDYIISSDFPILGICLGHQLIALALGGTTEKLNCGHHGTNHPIKDLETGKLYISTHNHEFTVNISNISEDIKPRFISLLDQTCEGFTNGNIIAVQFHPEASAGPHDTKFIFLEFMKRIKKYEKQSSFK